MLHVPSDSIIESVIAVGGVLLWVSSFCCIFSRITCSIEEFG